MRNYENLKLFLSLTVEICMIISPLGSNGPQVCVIRLKNFPYYITWLGLKQRQQGNSTIFRREIDGARENEKERERGREREERA